MLNSQLSLIFPSWIRPFKKKKPNASFYPPFYPQKQLIPLTGQIYFFAFEIKKKRSTSMDIQESHVFFSGPLRKNRFVRQGFRVFFSTIARQALSPLVADLSKKLGLSYKGLRFKNQKSVWGSCSELANINLNSKLLFLPKDLIEYVIIHELCHLKHLNHSPMFWKLVQKHCPDYQKKEKQLQSANQYVPKWIARL